MIKQIDEKISRLIHWNGSLLFVLRDPFFQVFIVDCIFVNNVKYLPFLNFVRTYDLALPAVLYILAIVI